jgi:hypothetical protein
VTSFFSFAFATPFRANKLQTFLKTVLKYIKEGIKNETKFRADIESFAKIAMIKVSKTALIVRI